MIVLGCVLVAGALLLRTFLHRRRLTALTRLPAASPPAASPPAASPPAASPPAASPPAASSPDASSPDGSSPDGSSPDGAVARGADPDAWGFRLATASGVSVPDGVRAAAEAHARRNDLGVVDLVPGDLQFAEALDLARAVDAAALRRPGPCLGRGAGYALLLSDDLVRRLEPARLADLEAGEMAELTVRARQFADRADVVVASLPSRRDLGGRRTWLTALCLTVPPHLAVPIGVARSATGWLLVAACLVFDLGWGLMPLAAYCAVPYVLTLGTGLRPRDRARAAWARPLHVPWTWWRTLRAPSTEWERHRIELREKSRAWHRARTSIDMFEERRPDCPWCGSSRLREHLVTRDTVMVKPGRFVLERCDDCGHIFQNPRLNPDGLDFYYRDVYDGLNASSTEHIFSGQTAWYRDRAELVAAHATPATWLDVGAGHGHFCATAAETLPDTVFDGLDLSAGIEEAARRRWVRRAVRGEFRAAASELGGRYDAVSMNHYLEHTSDPAAELDAAVAVLAPGGHLLIELPDPESWVGRVLRGYWIAWLPPQHLNMIPMGNLASALEARGLEIVATERRGVREEPDFTTAALLLANVLGPDPHRPWATSGHPGRHARRAFAYAAVLPLVVLAAVTDLIVRVVRPGNSNAYRVLARKPHASGT
ncbi:class I SAM-dependent methyltransferase [Actinomadura rupiterrae]|uniref:class I SAM-dependent methyltransferase n=1 Tax=Actinomadura rupiterrae TaxID=559627 RepID=UPI0020A3D527|nr:class I SAM-dependent methyltransferase [Actinomadura rupiterrae]MCP2343671.1 ubiquinone/menaquinone biosynthesis C-methylase UbiE [Actinomadura rupiterrae]